MAYEVKQNSNCVVITRRIHVVPLEEQTNAYKLFHHKFPVMIPQIFAMNQDTLERMGRPTSGNKKFDDEVMTQYSPMLLCPADMVDMQQRGALIEFKDNEQAAKIFMIVHGHLKDWVTFLREGFLSREVPTADLQHLDEFAAKLYRYSLRALSKDTLNDTYGSRVNAMAARRGFSLTRTQQANNKDRYNSKYTPLFPIIADLINDQEKKSRY